MEADFLTRARNKVSDIPARLSDLRDRIAPGDFARLHNRVRPYTMLRAARLRALYNAVRYVVGRNIPGAVVECGTAAGGSAALMALTLKDLGASRDVWLFDTFEGLPAPTDDDPARAREFVGTCRGELSQVKSLFYDFGLSAHFVKGLFRNTLPEPDVERIAVLHVDGDWYESVRDCLVHLYDRVSPGGVIQIDDYGHWEGAGKAVDEFFRSRHVHLRYVDYSARRIIKP